jgi:hypothetical protein
MSKEEFLKLSDLDKVKYAIEESLKEHKGYKSEYWKGSAFMGESILQTIEQVKKFAIPVVRKCTCKIPEPKVKCSENGINAYCCKCAKGL